MLSIEIICVGKLKENYLKDAISEYSKRLSKYCKLNITELSDEKIPDKSNSSIENEIKNKWKWTWNVGRWKRRKTR